MMISDDGSMASPSCIKGIRGVYITYTALCEQQREDRSNNYSVMFCAALTTIMEYIKTNIFFLLEVFDTVNISM